MIQINCQMSKENVLNDQPSKVKVMQDSPKTHAWMTISHDARDARKSSFNLLHQHQVDPLSTMAAPGLHSDLFDDVSLWDNHRPDCATCVASIRGGGDWGEILGIHPARLTAHLSALSDFSFIFCPN